MISIALILHQGGISPSNRDLSALRLDSPCLWHGSPVSLSRPHGLHKVPNSVGSPVSPRSSDVALLVDQGSLYFVDITPDKQYESSQPIRVF